MKGPFVVVLTWAVVALLLCVPSAGAQRVSSTVSFINVSIGASSLVPGTVRSPIGGVVQWTNNAGSPRRVRDQGYFDSGLLLSGGVFPLTVMLTVGSEVGYEAVDANGTTVATGRLCVEYCRSDMFPRAYLPIVRR